MLLSVGQNDHKPVFNDDNTITAEIKISAVVFIQKHINLVVIDNTAHMYTLELRGRSVDLSFVFK